MTDMKPGGSNPKQYGLPDGATELQDLIEHRDMNFALGNIFKAVYRLGNCDHSDAARDLRKIIWFAERELARHEIAQREDEIKQAAVRKIPPVHRNDCDGVPLDFDIIKRAQETIRENEWKKEQPAKLKPITEKRTPEQLVNQRILESELAAAKVRNTYRTTLMELYQGKPYPFPSAPE